MRAADRSVLVDNSKILPRECAKPAVTIMGDVIDNAVFNAVNVGVFMLPMTRSE